MANPTAPNLAERLNDREAAQESGLAVQGKTIFDLTRDLESQVRAALPRHLDSGRFIRLALTSLRTVPRLHECTTQSILAAFMQAAQLGLEIDANRGQAYVIPRWNNKTKTREANFQVGYHGLIDLAGRGGITVEALDIHANDTFRFGYGTGATEGIEHTWSLLSDRGEVIGYWAKAKTPEGREHFMVLRHDEAEIIRDRFASTKNQQGKVVGPWLDHFDAMARKSVIIRLLNYLPLPVQLAEAIAFDDVPIDVTPDELALPAPPPERDPEVAEPGSEAAPGDSTEVRDEASSPDIPPAESAEPDPGSAAPETIDCDACEGGQRPPENGEPCSKCGGAGELEVAEKTDAKSTTKKGASR